MKTTVRVVMAVFFVIAGLNHFRDPAFYVAMTPPWIPRPELVHRIAGAAEERVASGHAVRLARGMKTTVRGLLAAFFVVAGLNHFRDPAFYLGMMPPWMPQPDLLHKIAGAAEILGGLGLVVPATRRLAAKGLILLLVMVFPANIHWALEGYMPGTPFGPVALWARLPFQAVFVFAVWWSVLKAAPAEPKKA